MKRFGIDKIGLVVMAHRQLAFVACALVTLVATLMFSTGLTFNGDIVDVLKANTAGYQTLQKVEEQFHPFSTDEVVVVESSGFNDARNYAALEEFVLELQLVDGIETAISLFMLPGSNNALEPFLGSAVADDLSPKQRLDQLSAVQPLLSDMLSEDRTMAIVILMVAQQNGAAETVLGPVARVDISELAAEYAPQLSVALSGIGEIHRAIEVALKRDQKSLALISTSLCILLSLLVFRSWRGAIICAVPPIVGAAWFFGFAAAANIVIDPITTIIPTLLIVVGFADAIHLYYSFNRARQHEPDLALAIQNAMTRTAPACFLTSLTTAVACLGIGFSSTESINTFAFSGFVGMFIQFAAVVLVFPLLAFWLGGPLSGSGVSALAKFSLVARLASKVLGYGKVVRPLAVFLFIFAVYAQFQLQIGFRLAEHLPVKSSLNQLENRLSAKSLASGQLYVLVHDSDGKKGFSDADATVLQSIVKAVFPDLSSHGASAIFPSTEQMDRLVEEGHPILGRYIARDRLSYLLALPIDLSLPANRIIAKATQISEDLDAAGFKGKYQIAGMSLLSAVEVPQMIKDLQWGFYAAIVMVMLVLMVATGSITLGLLSLIPNLVPILGVETWLYLSGQQLTMTSAVALTIAFGIAVDDTIHFLNSYQQAKANDQASSLSVAIGDVVSPMATSTLLLVGGLIVTQVSALPSVAIFGQMVSVSLVLALIASLFLLPAFIEPFNRAKGM